MLYFTENIVKIFTACVISFLDNGLSSSVGEVSEGKKGNKRKYPSWLNVGKGQSYGFKVNKRRLKEKRDIHEVYLSGGLGVLCRRVSSGDEKTGYQYSNNVEVLGIILSRNKSKGSSLISYNLKPIVSDNDELEERLVKAYTTKKLFTGKQKEEDASSPLVSPTFSYAYSKMISGTQEETRGKASEALEKNIGTIPGNQNLVSTQKDGKGVIYEVQIDEENSMIQVVVHGRSESSQNLLSGSQIEITLMSDSESMKVISSIKSSDTKSVGKIKGKRFGRMSKESGYHKRFLNSEGKEMLFEFASSTNMFSRRAMLILDGKVGKKIRYKKTMMFSEKKLGALVYETVKGGVKIHGRVVGYSGKDLNIQAVSDYTEALREINQNHRPPFTNVVI